jgi:hypothetical protein
MSDKNKKLKEWPAINEAWKHVKEERIELPGGFVFRRIVRVPTFGELKKTADSVFFDELKKCVRR